MWCSSRQDAPSGASGAREDTLDSDPEVGEAAPPVIERNPKYIEEILRRWRPILRYVFRVESHGIELLAPASYVFVSNHNIGAAIEIMALLNLWQSSFEHLAIYGLAHPFVFKLPRYREYFYKIGGIPATYEAAYQALSSAASIIVFPGGNWEVLRPFHQRHRCDLGQHKGWARIALKTNLKVVPISISGSHSVNPVLVRSRWLCSILVIPRLVGLKYFPVTLSQLVWAALAYVAVGWLLPVWVAGCAAFAAFVATPLYPVWPARIRIRFGTPIDLAALTSGIRNEEAALQKCYDRVSEEIQMGMNELRQKPAKTRRM